MKVKLVTRGQYDNSNNKQQAIPVWLNVVNYEYRVNCWKRESLFLPILRSPFKTNVITSKIIKVIMYLDKSEISSLKELVSSFHVTKPVTHPPRNLISGTPKYTMTTVWHITNNYLTVSFFTYSEKHSIFAEACVTIFGHQLAQADLLLYIKAKARQHLCTLIHHIIFPKYMDIWVNDI